MAGGDGKGGERGVRGGWGGGGKHWLGVLWRGPGALGNDLDEP